MGQNGTPFLIPFGAFGMVAHPNRWRAQPGELTLAENVVVENDLLQKDPASGGYYRSDEGTVPPEWFSFGGTFTTAQVSYYLTAWFEGQMTAPPVPAFRAAATGATSPFVQPVNIAPVAVGQLFVIAFSREAGTGGVASVTDSAGNVYTRAARNDQVAANILQELWVSLITQPLPLTAQLTLTFTSSPLDVSVVGVAYAGPWRTAIPFASMHSFTGGGGAIPFSMTDNPPARPHRYPALGVGILSTESPTSVIGTIAPWTAVDVVNAGGHKTWQVAQPYPNNGGIAAQIEWTANAPVNVAATGTVAVSKGSRTVTGTGTNFKVAPFVPGDAIIIGGETKIVDSVTSNLLLTTIDPWEHSDTGATYARRSGPCLITAQTRMYDPGKQTQLVIWKELPANGARGRGGQIDSQEAYGPTNGITRAARFVVGGKEIATEPRKLFYFSGVDPVQVMKGDGNTFVPLTAPAADWATTTDPNKQPINGIVHQDALAAFGNWNDPHRVYFSQTQDHTSFTGGDAFQLKISSNIGERLYGCAQYQGVLFFWKYPAGIFYLDDTNPDRLTQWGYRVRSQALGCAPSPHAVLAIDDDVIFCDPAGHFHLLSAVNTLGGTADSDLTRALGLQRWTLEHLSMASLEHLVSVYDPHTKTAWFGLRSIEAATAGSADNDLIIRFDCARRAEGGPIRVTTSRTWMPNSLCLKRRNYRGRACVLIGEIADSWMTDPERYGSRTDHDWVAGVDVVRGIPTVAALPEHDCDEANAKLRHIRKAFRSLEVVMEEPAATPQTLFVDLYVDTQLRQTVSFALNGSRRMLHSILVGEGYTLTAQCRTDGSVAADAPLVGLIVYYAPTGQDMSRRS